MILFNSGVKGISTCLNLLRFLDLIDFIVYAIHCPEGFIKESQPNVNPDLVRTRLYLVNQVGPSSAFIKHCFLTVFLAQVIKPQAKKPVML